MNDVDKVIAKLEEIGVPAWEAVIHMVLIQGWMFLICGTLGGLILGIVALKLRRYALRDEWQGLVFWIALFVMFIPIGFIINGIYNLLATEGIAISKIL